MVRSAKYPNISPYASEKERNVSNFSPALEQAITGISSSSFFFALYDADFTTKVTLFFFFIIRGQPIGLSFFLLFPQEQARQLVLAIIETRGHPIFVRDLVLASLLNAIAALIFGKTFAPGGSTSNHLVRTLGRSADSFAAGTHVSYLPGVVEKFASVMPFTNLASIRRNMEQMLEFVRYVSLRACHFGSVMVIRRIMREINSSRYAVHVK